ncbi:alpha/beta-hydrolase [Periconia macrospinosa]|uniref:Alpha/beta-hydrolase n=1 Tax=Periconia macrospinosa TaxID=97972 RepID=A0A2V1EB32_9PLEO|nr:alpha/beta-hydrolase [Periconia macrospinosa]
MSQFSCVPPSALSKPKPFQVSIPSQKLQESIDVSASLTNGLATPSRNGREIRLELVQRKTQRLGFVLRKQHIGNKPKPESTTCPTSPSPYTHHPNTTSEPLSIHFVALFSQNPRAVPLLLLHGWPGNFMEFLPILEILKERYTPETLPYHVVVPSLPGYAFSSGPHVETNFKLSDIAAVLHAFMGELGFGGGFVVQGGIIGNKVARVMGATYETVKAVHVNFCIMPRPAGFVDDGDLNDWEKQGPERADEFKKLGSAYALLHATKTSTIGLVLAANPLSLLAWHEQGSARSFWHGQIKTLPLMRFSRTSLYIGSPRHFRDPSTLTDSSSLPVALARTKTQPGTCESRWGSRGSLRSWRRFRARWAATTGDLVWYREHHAGGHFAAVERPEVLLVDIEDFIKQVWKM